MTAPSLTDVTALPALLTGRVQPEFIDVNGHMNIRHYLDACAEAADVLCRRAGIDDDYRAERKLGVFTAEHHIRYYSEMHLGEDFTAHTRLLGVSAKVIHLMSFLVDRSHQQVACTLEITLVHVGLDNRSAAAIPADVAAKLDAIAAEHARLGWDAPVVGTMGPRS